MSMKKYLALLLAFVMVFSLAVPAFAAEEATETVVEPYAVPADVAGKAVILHSNDVHGAIEGYAKMGTLKAMFEAAGADVIVVDAGDYIQGETYVSVSQGESAVELMNMAGYQLSALGNHEFDYGYDNMKALEEKASFEILAANIVNEKGEPLFGTTKILEAGGHAIGFFGLDTPETATKAHPAKIQGVKFLGGEDLYECATLNVGFLKEDGADIIVCLGHLGIDDETAANGNRSIDMLGKVSGIDVLIDGHSHSTEVEIAEKTNADRTVNGAVVTSTGTKFENIGVVIIDKDGNITTECVATDAIPVAEEDPIAVRAAAIKAEIEAEYGKAFAKSEVLLNGDRAPGNRTEETNMGDLITDAMLWFATKEDLGVATENVVAITNGGGIRAAIAAGDISKNDVNKVLPFGNTVAVDYVSGSVLLEVLEASTFCTPTAVGGFPHVSGLTFTLDTTKAYDAGENYPDTTYAAPNSINRVTITSVNGKEFDPEATYAVVTNDFLAAGGDTYYALSVSEKITDTGVPLDEVLMQYITDVLGGVVGEKYAAPAGRITILKDVLADYADLDASAWYAEAVREVINAGLMKGTGNGFEPYGTVTRATVFQSLYNLEGKPAVNNKKATFPDARGTWYEDAARWAEDVGLTNGDGTGNFAGDREATRAEIVTIYARYAEMKVGHELDTDTNILSYTDAETIGEWAIPAFQWACGKQIIQGTDNLLLPGKTASRVELAQIVANFLDVANDYNNASPSGEALPLTKAVSISKYGNVTTDLTIADLTEAGYEVGDILSVQLSHQAEALAIPYGTGYSNVDQGSNVALADGDYLAIAINRGDFATTYGLATKGEDNTWILADVTLSIAMGEKGGYLEELMMREVDSKRTNNREDYASDEVFANFRNITAGNIAAGRLYRTSSPVNPELGRNTYADELLQEAGVKYVVNLADCRKSVKLYEGYDQTYYATLTDDTVHLNMTVDMYSEESLGDLKVGLTLLADKPGPFAFHCTEGKDRAGYFAMLVEALMGASTQEIVEDYMVSFENYYFVEKGSEQWNKIAESNIKKDLCKLAGVTAEELDQVDWAEAAEKYVTEMIGLTTQQVEAIRTNLSTPVA